MIELIIVIVILGVLAAILIPNLSGFTKQSQKKADIATAKILATAATTLYTDDASISGTWDAEGENVELDSLLANGFDWNTQYAAGTFTVVLDTYGEVTIHNGATENELYPMQTGIYD